MDNLDKVIDGLECCQYDSKSHCDGCPYNNEGWIGHCSASLASDALDYLNEQDEKLKEYEKLSQVLFKIEKYFKIKDLEFLVNGIENGSIVVLQDDGHFIGSTPIKETTIKIRRM